MRVMVERIEARIHEGKVLFADVRARNAHAEFGWRVVPPFPIPHVGDEFELIPVREG